MTQDEIEAPIRAEWDRLSKAENAGKDRVLAFCERMARQHRFRNGDSKSIIDSWVTRWHRSSKRRK